MVNVSTDLEYPCSKMPENECMKLVVFMCEKLGFVLHNNLDSHLKQYGINHSYRYVVLDAKGHELISMYSWTLAADSIKELFECICFTPYFYRYYIYLFRIPNPFYGKWSVLKNAESYEEALVLLDLGEINDTSN